MTVNPDQLAPQNLAERRKFEDIVRQLEACSRPTVAKCVEKPEETVNTLRAVETKTEL